MNELDKFGEFFVANTRDKIFENLEFLLAGKWKAPEKQKLQRALQSFSEDQKETIKDLIDDITIGAMHDLLFAFQEVSDSEKGIIISIDGKNIAQESDGLHGEIFTEDGWIKRFSKFEYNEK